MRCDAIRVQHKKLNVINGQVCHSFIHYKSISFVSVSDSYSTVQLQFLIGSRRYSCTAVGFTIVTVDDITITNATAVTVSGR